MADPLLMSSTVTSLKSASEIAAGLGGLRDPGALQAKTIELQRLIVAALADAATAQAQQLDLLDKLRKLEADLATRDAWEEVAGRYRLKDFGGATFAYELIEGKTNEPKHLACPNCYQQRKISILQFDDTYMGRKRFTCSACDKHVELGVHDLSAYNRSAITDYDPFGN